MDEIGRDDISKIQVSSVTRNDKNFGKENLFDGLEDTCWTSGEGSPQWITVELKRPHRVPSFTFQFQGGFVGKNCKIELAKGENVHSEEFYPEDVNSVQTFTLAEPPVADRLKFWFGESTDFFGRIIVYSLKIFTDRAE